MSVPKSRRNVSKYSIEYKAMELHDAIQALYDKLNGLIGSYCNIYLLKPLQLSEEVLVNCIKGDETRTYYEEEQRQRLFYYNTAMDSLNALDVVFGKSTAYRYGLGVTDEVKHRFTGITKHELEHVVMLIVELRGMLSATCGLADRDIRLKQIL